MAKALIKITHRQIIDAASITAFEKDVFNASYDDFLLKSLDYNRDLKFKTFTQMAVNDGRANALHYKLNGVVLPFFNTLHKIIPGLKYSMDKPVYFEQVELRLIESDITDKNAHQLAVYYTTPVLLLHEIIGEYLLLSADPDKTLMNNPVDTQMLRLDPQRTSISSYQELMSINLPGRITTADIN